MPEMRLIRTRLSYNENKNIVERLRNYPSDLMNEAADEIEKLRESLKRYDAYIKAISDAEGDN